jgi:hypothetical protein
MQETRETRFGDNPPSSVVSSHGLTVHAFVNPRIFFRQFEAWYHCIISSVLVAVIVLHLGTFEMIRPLLAANPANFHSLSRRRLYSSATFKPLRILFCGSDLFSGQSLKAVHAEQQRNPKLIASIDVLVKRAKPAGRGLKQKRDGNSQLLINLCGASTNSNSTNQIYCPAARTADS